MYATKCYKTKKVPPFDETFSKALPDFSPAFYSCQIDFLPNADANVIIFYQSGTRSDEI